MSLELCFKKHIEKFHGKVMELWLTWVLTHKSKPTSYSRKDKPSKTLGAVSKNAEGFSCTRQSNKERERERGDAGRDSERAGSLWLTANALFFAVSARWLKGDCTVAHMATEELCNSIHVSRRMYFPLHLGQFLWKIPALATLATNGKWLNEELGREEK